MNRTKASVFITTFVLALNWITPFIAYQQMNNFLSKPHCDSSSTEPCCNGIEKPNFQLKELEFTEKEVSGLYFRVENPKSDYWVRPVALNLILCISWTIFMPIMYSCFYVWRTPGSPQPTPTITYKTRNAIIIGVFLLYGIISSLTFLLGGPEFKYEFFGLNDSPIYVKNKEKYLEISNLYLYKTFGADDCGSNLPLDTSLDIPVISRIKINIPISSRSRGISNPCKKTGLTLYANSNFTGIYSKKQVGPWSVEIVEPGGYITNTPRSFSLVPECVSKMEEIITISSGNLIIPISYLVGIILIFLFPSEYTVNRPRVVPIVRPVPPEIRYAVSNERIGIQGMTCSRGT